MVKVVFLYFHLMVSHIKKSLKLFLLTLFISQGLCLSQPHYFSHLQVENGLSNNAVMCSLQDHKGFMWFGTRDGLNRFDGLSFKIFRNNLNDDKSIGSNAITSLSEDNNQKIWVGTEKGLFVYDSKIESFSKLTVAGNYSIRDAKANGSNVWYILLYTLYKYNLKTGKLKQYKIGKEVTSYSVMNDTDLWMSTSAGTIIKYNDSTDRYTETDVFNKSSYAVSKWIESIFVTPQGLILIGTFNQGLKVLDTKTGTYKDILTFNTDKTEIIVRHILPISPYDYWIGTQSGIYILNIKTGKSLHLTRQQNDPYSLTDNIVHTVSKDNEGGIWAGTYFGGINYYPKQYITFKKFYPKSCSNSITGSAVREICNDNNGNLWIGTEDAGLSRFDPVSGLFTNFNPETTKQSISYTNVHGLLINGNEVWAGTYLHGLDVLDARTGKRIRNYTTGNCSIESNFIYSLYKTKSNLILVATDKGLYEYIPQKNDFKLVTAVRKVFYRTLCEDRNGTIWAGSYGDGVFYYNTKTGENGQFTLDANNPSTLASNLINKIFEDSNGTLWFATENGLCRYDAKNKTFKRLTKTNGFPSDVTYSILEDSKKNLWISTSKGLVCFSPDNLNIKIFTKSHGLLTDQFNYSSGYKDNKGRMYFGSVKGLISFHPDSIINNTTSAPVFITGFQVYNKELLIGEKGSPLKSSIITAKEINLSYNQSSFSIDFAALSYTAPDMNKYAYILEGLDNTWTYLETNRKVYFTDLNPGSYTFKVKAVTDGGSNYGATAILKINIVPPFWKTWWAYIIYSILVIASMSLILQYFISRSKERNKRRLEKMEFDIERENYKDKFEFFTNLAHEIRTPLTLIKGPMENIMERADEVPGIKSSLDIMNRNTERLIQLSNQLLDFRKFEMNGFKLNFSREDITKLLTDHYVNFGIIAEQKNLSTSINFPDSFYAFIDVEAFNKIISNLWDNAVKYAKSKVIVTLSGSINEAGMYSISFKNDGYLIPIEIKEKIFTSFYRAKETNRLPGTGIGLTLARSLAEFHGGTLTLGWNDKEMNEFILTLPIDPK